MAPDSLPTSVTTTPCEASGKGVEHEAANGVTIPNTAEHCPVPSQKEANIKRRRCRYVMLARACSGSQSWQELDTEWSSKCEQVLLRTKKVAKEHGSNKL